ncbi:MAG: pentapeptide repeat-containing protein [Deltaproteobacteria bacterium]|nr:pentapeptide repeat-containing protein [Deltaproteobacteria bacterium]
MNFSKCQFESYADFYGCEFNEAKFNDCRIKQGSFDDASFESLSLQGLITEGNLNFNIRGVEGFFDLQPASLGRSIEILNCKIGILKYKAHTGEKIKFNQTNLGFAVFKNTDCSKLSFLNMSLQKALFWGADLQGTRFEACEWEKAQPRKYSEQPPRLIRILIWFIRLIFLYLWTFKSDEISKVKGHDGIFEKINQFIKLPKQTIGDEQNKDPETKLKLLLSLYRQLKKNYEENHDFRQAGDSHYREMETRLLRMKYLKVLKKNQSKTEDKTKIEKVGFGEFHLFRFYGFISDFGENFPKLFEVLIRSVVYIGLLVAFIESGWVKKGVFYVNCWIKSKIPILASILEGIGWIINGIGRVVTAVASPLVKSGVLEGLNVFSKLLIGLETLFVFGVATLLVMAVRRRFRR